MQRSKHGHALRRSAAFRKKPKPAALAFAALSKTRPIANRSLSSIALAARWSAYFKCKEIEYMKRILPTDSFHAVLS